MHVFSHGCTKCMAIANVHRLSGPKHIEHNVWKISKDLKNSIQHAFIHLSTVYNDNQSINMFTCRFKPMNWFNTIAYAYAIANEFANRVLQIVPIMLYFGCPHCLLINSNISGFFYLSKQDTSNDICYNVLFKEYFLLFCNIQFKCQHINCTCVAS